MTKKTNKIVDYRNALGVLGVLALIVSVSAVAFAQSGNNVTVNGDYYDQRSGSEGSLGGFDPIASESGFTDVNVSNDLRVQGEFVATGTTTVGLLTYDSNNSASLTFTAAATTTVGGLFSIQNTGAPRVCHLVELDIATGSTSGGAEDTGSAFAFRVATSTSASAWSGGSSALSLITSTTQATSTSAVIFNSNDNAGLGLDSWVWDNGVYINGAFDDASLSSGGTDYSTSSAAYTSMAGSVFIDCHTR